MKYLICTLSFFCLMSASAFAFSSAENRLVKQPLDHGDVNAGFFSQDVQILLPSGVPKSAPVIFYLGGEGGPVDLKNMGSAFLREHQAILIQANHRGYGSYSENTDQSLPSYVNSQQAIEDFHRDIQLLKQEFPGPWVIVGYSYSGSLALQLALKYPDDAKVVVASSAPVSYPFAIRSHDQSMRADWSPELYRKLAKHIEELHPVSSFDQNWQDRLFLQSLLVGVSQYKSYARLSRILNILSDLPTKNFLRSLHQLDSIVAGNRANDWSISQGSVNLSLTEAKTRNFHGHYWAYQQCNEIGSFFVSSEVTGIFPQTPAEYVNYCQNLFGIKPNPSRVWELVKPISELKVPLVYVAGAKDPWANLGLRLNDSVPRMKYIDSQNGYHCPDRDDSAISKKMVDAVFDYLSI